MAARSKLFMTNRSQAVRLPKAVAFPGGNREVEITQSREHGLITPVGQTGPNGFCTVRGIRRFMTEREQPEPEEAGAALMRYMLDTDISIYLIVILAGAARAFRQPAWGTLYLCDNPGELRFGAEKSARRMQ